MSTRAAIARPDSANEAAFAGVYHHWDGYPTALGLWLRHLWRTTFGRDTKRMLRFLVDAHPAGWSSLIGTDLSLPPGFIEHGGGFALPCTVGSCRQTGNAHLCQTYGPEHHAAKGLLYPCGSNYAQHLGHDHRPDPAAVEAERRIPQCYCHGSRHEDPWTVTQDNASGSGVEWVYVIDGPILHVLSSRTADGDKMIGMFGMGDPDASWVGVARINMADPTEPDWEAIEARG